MAPMELEGIALGVAVISQRGPPVEFLQALCLNPKP